MYFLHTKCGILE